MVVFIYKGYFKDLEGYANVLQTKLLNCKVNVQITDPIKDHKQPKNKIATALIVLVAMPKVILFAKS